VADVTIIDPAYEYVIDPAAFVSKGKNTPFGGRKVHGRIVATICNGEFAYKA
jgi:dihydroorotase